MMAIMTKTMAIMTMETMTITAMMTRQSVLCWELNPWMRCDGMRCDGMRCDGTQCNAVVWCPSFVAYLFYILHCAHENYYQVSVSVSLFAGRSVGDRVYMACANKRMNRRVKGGAKKKKQTNVLFARANTHQAPDILLLLLSFGWFILVIMSSATCIYMCILGSQCASRALPSCFLQARRLEAIRDDSDQQHDISNVDQPVLVLVILRDVDE